MHAFMHARTAYRYKQSREINRGGRHLAAHVQGSKVYNKSQFCHALVRVQAFHFNGIT
jgi:hypothetical protein